MELAAQQSGANLNLDASDESIYKAIIDAIDRYTGQEYLSYLVKFMASAMKTQYAFVSSNVDQDPITKFKTVAHWVGEGLGNSIEYELKGTPCELLVKDRHPKFYGSKLGDAFPKEKAQGYDSYHAVPIFNYDDEIVGHIGVKDTKPMPEKERFKREALLRVLALRVESELTRIHRDEERTILISETIQQKKKLESNNEQLKILNEEKNYFIKFLSHDLRSPLNHIRSLTELLTHDGLTKDQKSILSKINEMSDRASSMITKLLDVGYIEGQHSNLQFDQFNANSVVTDQVFMFKEAAKDKNIELILYKDSNRHYIRADKSSFIQILDNVFSNAIKFSPKNSKVTIGIKNHQGNTRIEVTDQGPGVSPEEMPRLFARFQKLSAQPTAGESSTGLGLYISKRLTEEMGGKIWCESPKGKGATFIIEFKKS